MRGKASGVSAPHRQVMQYLRAGNWVPISKLPEVGEGTLARILQNGWIERQGVGPRSEIRITPAGLAALQKPV